MDEQNNTAPETQQESNQPPTSVESERYVKSNVFDVVGEIVSSVCFGASLTVSSIGDALHDWWDDHQPWWWPFL